MSYLSLCLYIYVLVYSLFSYMPCYLMCIYFSYVYYISLFRLVFPRYFICLYCVATFARKECFHTKGNLALKEVLALISNKEQIG